MSWINQTRVDERPFLLDDRPLLAPPEPGASGWSEIEAALPQPGELSPETRAGLAAAWTRDALAEHASAASFARFSLELLAAGAPADLVALAHEAALDEVRHARLCFSLAGGVEIAADLASIAARTVGEGCIGERLPRSWRPSSSRARSTRPCAPRSK